MWKRMIVIVAICLCSVAVQASAQLNQDLLVNIRGVIFEALADKTTLCVINTQNEGPQWFRLQSGGIGMNERLGAISEGYGLIDSVKASPNGQYLAIISVGEGHPILELIDLPTFLTKKTYQVVHTVDPYPGTITLSEWKGAELYFNSNVLLTERDSQTGRVDPEYVLSWQETFALNPAVGKIRGASEGAKNPAKRYTQILLNPQSSEREKDVALLKLLSHASDDLTMEALVNILDQEQDPKRINTLLDVISKLRKKQH